MVICSTIRDKNFTFSFVSRQHSTCNVFDYLFSSSLPYGISFSFATLHIFSISSFYLSSRTLLRVPSPVHTVGWEKKSGRQWLKEEQEKNLCKVTVRVKAMQGLTSDPSKPCINWTSVPTMHWKVALLTQGIMGAVLSTPLLCAFV